jgi:hypothetical protein
MILLHIRNNDNLSHWRTKFKYYAKMLMHTKSNASPFLLMIKFKF